MVDQDELDWKVIGVDANGKYASQWNGRCHTPFAPKLSCLGEGRRFGRCPQRAHG